ncbi:MAG: hypothetical protein M0P12_01590 [Paludibacteraceae bacterium]|nr:hypothetical protein [Paludibacteraceae bacterium]
MPLKIHVIEDTVGTILYGNRGREIKVPSGEYVVYGIQDFGYRIHIYENGEMKDVFVRGNFYCREIR